MGIYIKGMGMPKNCYICDDIFLLSTIRCECPNFAINERPSDCPLIEVSEPHGRLIDADMAYQETMKYGEHFRKSVLKTIDNLPTVIESEVEE